MDVAMLRRPPVPSPPSDSVSIGSQRSSPLLPPSSSSSYVASSSDDERSDLSGRSRRRSDNDDVPSRTADRRSEYEYSPSLSPSSASASSSQSASASASDISRHRDRPRPRTPFDSESEFDSAEDDSTADDGAEFEYSDDDDDDRSDDSVPPSLNASSSDYTTANDSSDFGASSTAAATAIATPSSEEVSRCHRVLQSGHVFTLHTLTRASTSAPTAPTVTSTRIVVFLVNRCLYGCEYRHGQYKYRQPIVAVPLHAITAMSIYLGAATPALAISHTHAPIADRSFAIRVKSTAPNNVATSFTRTALFDENDSAVDDYALELSAPTGSDMKYWLRTLHTALCHSFGVVVNRSLFYVQHDGDGDGGDADRAIKRIRFARADSARARNVEERLARADVERRMQYDRHCEQRHRAPHSTAAPHSLHSRTKSLTVQTGHITVPPQQLGRTGQLALELPKIMHISQSTPILRR